MKISISLVRLTLVYAYVSKSFKNIQFAICIIFREVTGLLHKDLWIVAAVMWSKRKISKNTKQCKQEKPLQAGKHSVHLFWSLH